MYIMKINDPWGGANYDPRRIILTILVEVHQTMPEEKISMLYAILLIILLGCHDNQISTWNKFFDSLSPKKKS
jgi:hypothetical protein